jgi:hypothetical protein
MNDQAPARAGSKAGKVVAIGIVLALVVTMAGIGHHHATRNRIRHAPGSLSGKQLYELYCDRCHGPDLKGDRNYPSIIVREHPLEELTKLFREGKNVMPKFVNTDGAVFFDATDVQRIKEYLDEKRAAQR